MSEGAYYTGEKRTVILQEKWIFLPKEKSHIIRKKVVLKNVILSKKRFSPQKVFFFFVYNMGEKTLFGKNDFFDQKK